MAYCKYLGLAVTILIITACTSTPEKTSNGDPEFIGHASVSPTPGLKPRERFTTALNLLENGKVSPAKVELLAYIESVPASQSIKARDILKQIDTPAKNYFPADFFTVSLGEGESLSTLAKTYLNDPLKFYALASFNDIAAPSRVYLGQTIRIPATDFALAALEQPKPRIPAPNINMPQIDTHPDSSSGNETESNNGNPNITETKSVEQTLNGMIASGNYAEAVTLIESLPADSADTETVSAVYFGYAEQTSKSNPYIAADTYYSLSELYQQSNDWESAVAVLKQALILNPDHVKAEKSIYKLQNKLAEEYYRKASAAFRRQDLDTTIAFSDKVLALNPEHSDAQLYRAQAIELKERLKVLNTRSN
ncbi:MAG: tetratricopeptide repeat protein [Pseudomonadales bacterium]|nr:tetratricopeptide repeat protein [Pseudomonadales bacterium]